MPAGISKCTPPMPCRYCRINTTRSSAVTATTLTQGGYSLIQYFGMIVPLGSCTRSTRTVYQGSRARYSLVNTVQAPGSSSKLTGGNLPLSGRARA